MTARQVATYALSLIERMHKQGLEAIDMMDVLVVANAIVQTQLAARARGQPKEPQDE